MKDKINGFPHVHAPRCSDVMQHSVSTSTWYLKTNECKKMRNSTNLEVVSYIWYQEMPCWQSTPWVVEISCVCLQLFCDVH